MIDFTRRDVERAKEVIEKHFKIVQKMDDKSEVLGTDRLGYRSVHYVVSISDERQNLPEYELQLRQ